MEKVNKSGEKEFVSTIRNNVVYDDKIGMFSITDELANRPEAYIAVKDVESLIKKGDHFLYDKEEDVYRSNSATFNDDLAINFQSWINFEAALNLEKKGVLVRADVNKGKHNEEEKSCDCTNDNDECIGCLAIDIIEDLIDFLDEREEFYNKEILAARSAKESRDLTIMQRAEKETVSTNLLILCNAIKNMLTPILELLDDEQAG